MKGMIIVAALGLTACAGMGGNAGLFPTAEEAVASSFKNIPDHMKSALVQDDSQKRCSADRKSISPKTMEFAETFNKKLPVVYPANGKLVGNWESGEKIAQSGYGLRKGDVSSRPTGGNCYACHQLKPQELSYGTLGPSLLHYGKLRGNKDDVVKYTYDKIYNTQQFVGCSNMPRFGHNKILSPEQIADVVALLVDPNSPVNK